MTHPRTRLSTLKQEFLEDLRVRIKTSHVISAYESAVLLQTLDALFCPQTIKKTRPRTSTQKDPSHG